MFTHRQFLSCLILSALGFNVDALEFKSSTQQTTLIELYTSEGCSSCPPAEAYLNSLKDDARLWQDFVPVAFHVDYWDYLGWRDRYASPAHRIRQESYATVNKQNTVYTPAFFVNGKPWRRGLLSRVPELATQQSGVLQLDIANDKISAAYTTQTDTEHGWALHVAVLGLGLTSDIAAGENRGRHSQHEFVVLQHHTVQSRDGHWQIQLNKNKLLSAERYALAAWVTIANDPRPLQAVGGYLPFVR